MTTDAGGPGSRRPPTGDHGGSPAARRASPILARIDLFASGASQESILNELRRVILSGEVLPGTPIPVAEVAARFGVSHIPVRESLKALFAERLVDHRPNAGYTVARLTHGELQELYIVRGVLEMAALAGGVANATAGDDETAQAALLALDESIEHQDHRAYHRESRRFHFAMLVPCRMYRLLHMLESAWNITEPSQPMAHIPQPNRNLLHAEHGDMLAAFLARDAPNLIELGARHQARLERSIAGLPPDSALFADGPRRLPDC